MLARALSLLCLRIIGTPLFGWPVRAVALLVSAEAPSRRVAAGSVTGSVAPVR